MLFAKLLLFCVVTAFSDLTVTSVKCAIQDDQNVTDGGPLLDNGNSDVCHRQRDPGVCFAFVLAWYYDTDTQQCEEFVYGGCGGNDNRFRSEDECYAHCIEKLVDLHPPQGVTIGMISDTELGIYWYLPINIQLLDNVTNDNWGYAGHVNSSDGAMNGSHVTVQPLSVSSKPPSSTDSPHANLTNSSSKTNDGNGTNDGTKTNETYSIKPSSTNTSDADDSTSTKTSVPGATSTATPEMAGRNVSITHYIGKTKVPFHFAKLIRYVVWYRPVTETKWSSRNLPSNTTDVRITGLRHSTAYQVKVSAVYKTNSSLDSTLIMVSTLPSASSAGNCKCDDQGTIGGARHCNLSLTQMPWCPCKKKYAGLFCEMCANGYYRTANSLPCQQCPCNKRSSLGSCHFVAGYLHCTRCHDGYTGILCQRCANGYYRDTRVSPVGCKKCEGCHNIKPGLICDPFNGTCLNCHYNTAGDKCDRCLPGYVGDPSKGIACVSAGGQSSGKFQPPSPGVIAAVVVSILVIVSVIVGVIVYRRMRAYPVHRPFWTVELKEDHDEVNFSSVPADDMDQDDMRFYERHEKSKTKSQPYAKLKEEF